METTFTSTVRIGTRGSELALWQARFLQSELAKVGARSELVIIKTKGDAIQHLSFDKIEGKGFFTKELEDALLRGDIDVAVHSMKDLPTTAPDGLVVAGVSYREDPADCLLIRPDAVDAEQPFQLQQHANVGTSSARRKAQMLHYRPDVRLHDIRGNVPTRIEKLRRGDFDAILLANAGLTRLQLDVSDLTVLRLSPKEFVPAPAQGVLAYQVAATDMPMRRLIQRIHQPAISQRTNVERKILQLMDGGCHLPLGAYCEVDAAGNYHVWATRAARWDAPAHYVRVSHSSSFELAETVWQQLMAISN